MFSVSFSTAILSNSMGRRRSSTSNAEILSALQKLEEILLQKELQISLLDLDVCSSQKNLSVVKNVKSNPSSNKLKIEAIDELRLVDEISEDFSGTEDAMKKEERLQVHRVMNSKKLLTDSRASCSNEVAKVSLANSSRGKIYVNSCEGKQVLQGGEIEQLKKRLEFLEGESKLMKLEFFEHVEEKKKLVKEIHQQFQTIYRCLQLENPVNGEKGRPLTVNPCKDGGLESDSSTCIVTDTDPRINFLTLKEAHEETWAYAHSE